MSFLKPLEVELKSDPESWGVVLDRVAHPTADGISVYLGVHWLVPPTGIQEGALDYCGPDELTTLSVIVSDDDLALLLEPDEDGDGDGEEFENEETEVEGSA